jgi:DNA-binding transcriptional regulator YiaG
MNKYKSEIYEAIHEDAKADFEVGAITEKRMREYDEMCLAPETPHEKDTYETIEIEHPDLVTA